MCAGAGPLTTGVWYEQTYDGTLYPPGSGCTVGPGPVQRVCTASQTCYPHNCFLRVGLCWRCGMHDVAAAFGLLGADCSGSLALVCAQGDVGSPADYSEAISINANDPYGGGGGW